LDVNEVDFVIVENITKEKLIIDPFREICMENCRRKLKFSASHLKSVQVDKSNSVVMKGVLFLVERYIVLKRKGWK
jgi:hypothetical protein